MAKGRHSFGGKRPAAFLLVALCAPLACSGSDDPGTAEAAGGSGGAPDAGDVAATDAGPPGPTRTVELSSGAVMGDLDQGAYRFLAIPYAEPPLGDLRWKAPAPPSAWDGVRHETDFVESCPQLADQGAPASNNEDCLYLNVWAPAGAVSDAPVMVWLHGGGNFSGGAGIPIPTTEQLWYDGHVFAASQGVVLVTLNYRLGPLGFYAHPALADEGAPMGNQGLLDQQRALEWVRDEIAAFGGDPNNVTLFGESAGSADVCYHVASPGSRGLFHRAVSESGGCTIRSVGPEATPEGIADKMVAYAEAVGCPAGDGQLACMRAASIEDILANGAQPSPGAGEVVDAPWQFAAVIDGPGGFLPDTPKSLFDRGDVAKVPYLLGSNHDEGTTFVFRAPALGTEDAYLEDLTLRFGDAAADVAAMYPPSKFGGDVDAARARVVGDSTVVCGTHDTARRAAAAGLPVYLYDFDVAWSLLPDILKAGHASEISHVFGTPHLPTDDPESAAVAVGMNTYWATFARTGDPNGDGAPAEWPTFSVDTDRRLHLHPDWAVLEDFRTEECAFWRAYYGAEP